MNDRHVPVLIVGGGPVGLAAAYVLGTFGVAALVCEQHETVNPHPRAHVVNTRSMELFRSWGIADAVTADALPMDWLTSIVWTTTLAGEHLGTLDLTAMPDDEILARLTASPQLAVSCAQDRVQTHLLERVRRQGVADVRFGARVTELLVADCAVRATIEQGGRPETVEADYVIAADGAGSWVRNRLGLRMSGMPPLGQQINVYFHADLSELTAGRPAVLYWTVNSTARGVFIAMDGRHRWTYNFDYNPALEGVGDYTPQRCTAIIHAALGRDDLEIDIRSVGGWTMCAETATRYRSGRVFLAGDAAHRFPPTGGIGMNTGLADADNLAWKLAAVLHGWGWPGLLDTYQAERRPVALSNTEYSVTNALKMAATGIGPTATGVVRRLESADPTEAAAQRLTLAAAIEEQRPHFGALNQDLGYRYDGRGAATRPDGSAPPVLRDQATHFVATARPGSRLPHAWVHAGGAVISTLDLVGPHLLVLAGSDAGDLGVELDGASPVPLKVVLIGADVVPADADLHVLLGITATGWVLVRPDGHVAARCHQGATASDLLAAVATLFAPPAP